MRNFKKFTSVLLVLLMLTFAVVPANAVVGTENANATENTQITETATIEDYGLIDDDYNRLTIPINGNINSFSSKFDPRNSNYLTDIKNQDRTSLCWMFSAVSLAEQYTSLKYGTKFNISESHGGVALSNKMINGSLKGNYGRSSYKGGYYGAAAQYITNWNSPLDCDYSWNSCVDENDYSLDKAFENVEEFKNNNTSFVESNSVINVTDTNYISRDITTMKEAIQNYGAVSINYYSYPSSYSIDSSGQKNYYLSEYPSEAYDPYANIWSTQNHSVNVVGWDDNYSKNNFGGTQKPSGNGAWLVRNSWGIGENNVDGYFWLSYEDISYLSAENEPSVITGVKRANNNEHMLSYDCMPVAGNVSTSKDVYMTNVYDVSDYKNDYNKITRVMLYIKSTCCDYSIRIVPVGSNSALPTNLSDYSELATGTYSGEGYLTANLSNPYNLSSYDKYAVVVKLTPKNNSDIIYLSNEQRATNITSYGPKIDTGTSFYYIDDDANQITWTDNCTANNYDIKGNFCIRPVLEKENLQADNISLTPTTITDNGNDVNVMLSTGATLFRIRTDDYRVLRQDRDYTINNNVITINKNYISSLNGDNERLVLEFSNNINKTITINPLSVISNVTVSGKTAVGKTLTATCTGVPSRDEYDLNYQWQSSTNGTNWYNISGATLQTYSPTTNDIMRYIRVVVTAQHYGNVVYPSTVYSNRTSTFVFKYGDANLDGVTNTKDATLIQKYLIGKEVLNDTQKLAADVDGDGDVDIIDVNLIQKYIADIIPSLPAENIP